MNKRILLVLMLVVGLMTGPAFAQSDFGEYGTILPVKGQSSLAFLKIGASPRAVAMGEAFVAMNGGIDASFLQSRCAGICFGR